MKTNIKIPHLEKVGINKSRFFAFIEIARHPDGISVGSIAEKLGETIQATQYTVNELQKGNYIKTTYEKREIHGKTYCFATPFGIDNVCKEMESVCRLIAHVRKEMIKNESK